MCSSYPPQDQTLTHLFAPPLLSEGLSRINQPDFKESEREWEEKCHKAIVNYDGPQQGEDYLLDSVDIEEKERADKATEKRRDMLPQRIKRFVFLFIRETEEVYLFSQYQSQSISLDRTLWKNA